MPGFHTHYFFGEYVIKDKSIEKRKSYNTGLQGPDVFFHYVPAYLLYDKNIGNIMHDRGANKMFKALFNERRYIKERGDKEALDIADSYIKGFMSHYTLDTVVHPYIYYRTKHIYHKERGLYDFSIHVFLETDIDNSLTRHYLKKEPTDFKPWQTISLSLKERRVISSLLYNAIKQAYKGESVRRISTLLSPLSMELDQFLMHDKYGRKKYAVRFLEEKIFHHAVVSSMIPSNDFSLYKDPLNLKKKTWKNPWDNEFSSNEDIFQMMERAADIMKKRTKLYDSEDFFALLSDLSDLSYKSGKKALQ